MQIDIKEVTDGAREGQVLYVCDYRKPDMNKKAIRAVPPTKVMVLSTDGLNKTVYYSKCYFAPLNKKDEPTAKVIVPYDNTGFRSYPGEPLNVFDTWEECVDCWNAQLEVVADKLKRHRATVLDSIDEEIAELNSRKEEY